MNKIEHMHRLFYCRQSFKRGSNWPRQSPAVQASLVPARAHDGDNEM